MSTTHMLDVYVLGQAESVGPAMLAFQQAIEAQFEMDREEGDVIGVMAPPMPTKAPWPEGFHVASNGAVFDHNTYGRPRSTIRDIANTVAQHPGVEAVVVTTWDFSGEGVSLILARSGMKPTSYRVNDSQFERWLGVDLQDCLNADDEVEGIGDRVLEHFLTKQRGRLKQLAPLYAVQQARELEARWPAAETSVPRPRLR